MHSVVGVVTYVGL